MSEALDLFVDEQNFLAALKEGEIKSRGCYFDELSGGLFTDQISISADTWKNFTFISTDNVLQGQVDISNYAEPSIDAWYESIEINKDDIEQLSIPPTPAKTSPLRMGRPTLIPQDRLYAEIASYIYISPKPDIPPANDSGKFKKWMEELYVTLPSLIDLNESSDGDTDKTVKRYLKRFLHMHYDNAKRMDKIR